ncbi:MAG TPA: DoxX family protein [Jatrophihabitans sp.]|jgi:putative oxidoreductase
MSGHYAPDTGLLIIRIALGVVFLAHGYNHIFGGGKIAGTGRWFESMGMKPGIFHAWIASLVEVGAGLFIAFGLLTPLVAGGIIGTMFVALITNHLKNGFFIFRPGEGYEYVLTLILVALGLGTIGAGRISIDHAIGIFDDGSWWGLLIAAVAGFGGGLGLLVTFWRPPNPVAGYLSPASEMKKSK